MHSHREACTSSNCCCRVCLTMRKKRKMKRRMRKEVTVMMMTSRSPSERSRTRLPIMVALATGDFPPYPALVPWHPGVRHLHLLWFIVMSTFASFPRSAEALSQTKKVDLEAIPQINGVSMLELDFEGLSDKPWRLPGMYIRTCLLRTTCSLMLPFVNL